MQLEDLSLAERTEGLWAFRRLIEATAKHGPIVLVLEDAHSSGPASLDLVEYLVGWTEAVSPRDLARTPRIARTTAGVA